MLRSIRWLLPGLILAVSGCVFGGKDGCDDIAPGDTRRCPGVTPPIFEAIEVHAVYPASLAEGRSGLITVHGAPFDGVTAVDLGGKAVGWRLLGTDRIELMVPPDLPVGPHDLRFHREEVVDIAENAFLVGGWVEVDARVGEFTQLTRVDDRTLLAVGRRGQLFRSADRAATWRQLRPGPLHCEVRHIKAFGEVLMLVTSCGLYVDDGAAEVWRHVGLEGAGDVDRLGSGALYALRDRKVMRSEDDGSTWTELSNAPAGHTTLRALSSGGETSLLAAGAPDGGLARWADGVWSSVEEVRSLAHLARSPVNEALAVTVSSIQLRRTLDGGATWESVPGPWQPTVEATWLRFDSQGCLWIAGPSQAHPHRSCDIESAEPTWEEIEVPGKVAVTLEDEGDILSTDGIGVHEGEGEGALQIGSALPYVPTFGLAVEPQGQGRIGVLSGERTMLSDDLGETWSTVIGCFNAILPTFERDSGLWSPRLFGLESDGTFVIGDDEDSSCEKVELAEHRLREFSTSRLSENRFAFTATRIGPERDGIVRLFTTDDAGATFTELPIPQSSTAMTNLQVVAVRGEDWICGHLEGVRCTRWDGSDPTVFGDSVFISVQQKGADTDRAWIRHKDQMFFSDDLKALTALHHPEGAIGLWTHGETLATTAWVEGTGRLHVSQDAGATWSDLGPVPNGQGGQLHFTASGQPLWEDPYGLYLVGPAIWPQ